MDQKDPKMSNAERRQHHVLFFSRHNEIYPQKVKKNKKQKQKQKICEIPTPPPPQQRNKCCKTQPIDSESNKKINCTKFYKIRWNSS